MQAVYALIGVVLIGGIVVFFMNTDAPGTQQDAAPTQEEDSVVEGDVVELGEENANEDEMMDASDDSDGETRPNDEVMEAEGEATAENDSVGGDTNAGPLDEETDTSGMDDEEADEKVFSVDGFNFDYSVDEIRVEEGDTVTINLTSTDGFHDWVVDEFDAATERVQTGETASVTFVADEAGSYEFYCSVGNHRQQGMVGTLVVE